MSSPSQVATRIVAEGSKRTPPSSAFSAIHAWRSLARLGGVVFDVIPPVCLTASVSDFGIRPPPATSTNSVDGNGSER